MRARTVVEPAADAPIPELSVFVPALDEAGNIAEVAKRIALGAKNADDTSFEIVFVDDGSTDGTSDRMIEVGESGVAVHVLQHRKPGGITQAMVTAFPAVRGDIVMWVPADLECDPAEDIPKLLAKMREDDLDVVCGWRQGRGDKKVAASWIYNKVSSVLFPVKVHDLNWIKAFRRDCLYDLKLRSDWHRFLVHIWAEQGFSVGEVKTTWHKRSYGSSKFGFNRFFGSFFDVIALRFNLTFSRKPLVFFGTAGLIFGLLGLAILSYLTWLYLVWSIQQRPIFIFGLVLLLVSFLLVCVGFLAELSVSSDSAAPLYRAKSRALRNKPARPRKKRAKRPKKPVATA